ncbi:MAG: hypothetical protein JWQ73_3268 [Variovorax sp.]|jgi:hypothetical protein|nr:hypothetical protein [Variovorax sp.]
MNKLQIITAAAALSLLAITGAQAENYDGVHTHVSVKNRADVDAEAVNTAAAPNQNVTRGSRGAEVFKSVANPDAVYANAVATAHAPDQNVTGGSKFNSRVVSTMARPEPAMQAQQATPAIAK